jgi:dihydrofolate reductase
MKQRPRLTLIAAVAHNGVIGRDGRIPWRIRGDLPRFKRITMGHPIVMGRRTWESLGGPLSGRRNVVVSRSAALRPAGAEAFASLDAALAACAGADEVFVIGGTEMYREALPLAHRLLLTELHADFAGDAHFPPFDRGAWREVDREAHHNEAGQPCDFDYVTYVRAGPADHFAA